MLSFTPRAEEMDAKRATRTATFPRDFESETMGKGIVFFIYEFNKRNAKRGETKNAIASIGLPLPNSLTDSSSVEYETLDILAMGTLTDSSNWLDKVKEGIDVVRRKAFKDAEAALGSNEVTNPRLNNRFRSVPFKNHSFEFNLIAKNQAESEEIFKIVNLFKYHMAPDVTNNSTFLHPEVFDFKFYPDDLHKKMYTPNRCALVGVSVTYNGSTTPTFFRDTLAPVEITLQLDFQELEIETKASIEEKYKVKSK